MVSPAQPETGKDADKFQARPMTFSTVQTDPVVSQPTDGDRHRHTVQCHDDVLERICCDPCTCLPEHSQLTDWLVFQRNAFATHP